MNERELLRARGVDAASGHAWLIWGGGDAERAALSDALAMAMVCSGAQPPCGACVDCQKARRGLHPDIIRVRRDENRQGIYVDQIRAIAADAVVMPNEAERKVYVLDEADRLVPQAQNAFLKLLEEPPGNVCFILSAGSTGAILPTVLSRCTRIRVGGSQEADVPPAAVELLAAWSTGGELERVKAALALEKCERALLGRVLDCFWTGLAREAVEAGEPEEKRKLMRMTEFAAGLRDMYGAAVSTGNIVGLLAVGPAET